MIIIDNNNNFVILQLIGRPYMPPYWSLGFQLSRYGYDSLDNLKAAVNRTLQANIPLVSWISFCLSVFAIHSSEFIVLQFNLVRSVSGGFIEDVVTSQEC